MGRFCKILLLTAVLFIGGAAFAGAKSEPLELIFEHYTSDDGLPHNSICDIHQDRQGYLWLCTWYGLSRYDGNGFVNYTMLPGDYSNLSHNRILSVDEDAEGYLWVTTYDYHVYRFDVDTEEFVAVPADLEGFPYTNMKVGEVLCDSKGDVWVAVDGAGLLRVRPDLSYIAYFGTNDLREVAARANAGDAECDTFLRGFCVSFAKYIAALSAVVCGEVDAIILTGGIAHNAAIVEEIGRRVRFIAPVVVYAGENELESLAENGYGILAGEFEIKHYHPDHF